MAPAQRKVTALLVVIRQGGSLGIQGRRGLPTTPTRPVRPFLARTTATSLQDIFTQTHDHGASNEAMAALKGKETVSAGFQIQFNKA